MNPESFGSCCDDLANAMKLPPASFFRVDDRGVLFLSVGYAQTESGTGFFDSAVFFCPFCGRELQTREAASQDASR